MDQLEVRAFVETPDGIESRPLDQRDALPSGYEIEYALYVNLIDGTQQWVADLEFTDQSKKMFEEEIFENNES